MLKTAFLILCLMLFPLSSHADLVQRLAHDPAVESISNHAFSASLYLWGRGKITRAQLVAAFNLTATEELQLNDIKAHFDSLTANEKLAFHGELESLGILLEGQFITQQQYKNLLNVN